jgi:hypothetical protein
MQSCRWVRIGTTNYLSSNPYPIEEHFNQIERSLRSGLRGTLRHRQTCDVDQQLLNPALPRAKVRELTERVREQSVERNRLSGGYFERAMIDLKPPISNPTRMPKPVARLMASLHIDHGTFNFGKPYLAVRDIYKTPPARWSYLSHQRPLIYCKTGLLLSAYYLGLRTESPDLSKFDKLPNLYHRPDLTKEIERDFMEFAASMSVESWLLELQKLTDKQLFELVKSLMAFSRCLDTLLRDSHAGLSPKERAVYVRLRDSLHQICKDSLLKASHNPNFDLDAIHHLLVKVNGNTNDPSYSQNPKAPNLDFEDSICATGCQHLMRIFQRDIQEQNHVDPHEKPHVASVVHKIGEDTERTHTILKALHLQTDHDKMLFIQLAKLLRQRNVVYRNKTDFFIVHPFVYQIYNYLRGYVSLSDLPIKRDNVQKYLNMLKYFDLLILHQNIQNIPFKTTNEIRKKLLQLCPNLTTIEAFILTRNQEEMKDQGHLENLANWTPESAAHSRRAIEKQLAAAAELAKEMSQTELKTKIIAGRGISGSGKSTILERKVKAIVDARNLKDKILDPDNLKRMLKQHRCLVLNPQIHEEASAYFKMLFRKFVDEQRMNFVLDKRLLTLNDVKKNLVEPAKKLNCSVILIDLHVDLRTSINRLLARPKYGPQPCPELSDWLDAAIKNTQHRSDIIHYAMEEKTIAEYELYTSTKQQVAARLTHNVFETVRLDDFTECLRIPRKTEIDELLNRKIDVKYINRAIADADILESQKDALNVYQGMSVGDAYKKHAETDDSKSY